MLLLDTAARTGDSLTDRLLSISGVDLEVQPVGNAEQFRAALSSGKFDFALIGARSPDTLASELPSFDLASLPPELPLILVFDEAPDGPQILDGRLPAGAVWLHRNFGAGDLLTAVPQAQINLGFASNPDGVLVLDADGRIELANPAAQRVLNRHAVDLLGVILDLPVDGQGLREWTTDDGRLVAWRSWSLGSANAPAVITLRDVTQRRASERALTFRADHDALTGVANVARMQMELRSALARAERDGGRVAVLYIDLDGFKQINDTYGHEVGDALLVAVVQRLTGVCRAGELLARVGGDELVIVTQNFPPGFEARIAERVLRSLTHPLQALGRAVRVGASVGVAVYPDHASDVEGLLRAADEAMYQAKRNGRDRYQLAAGHADTVSRQRQDIATGLEQGLLRGEFELLYQPLLDFKRGRFMGAEALLRWNRPHVGVLHPLQFLDVAETSGLILGIGDWVLDHLCQQLAQWRWVLGEDFFVCANLSATQLRRSDFAGRFRRILHSHGLTSNAVRLEVSETVMAQELGRALGHITGETDIHLAVENVSQGLLSMRNISSLPIRSLKLDQTLVAELPHDTLSAQLAEALIAIGRTFGLSIVAEGVETTAQLNFLRERGCDYCQGFLLSAPVAAADLPSLVNTPELLSGLLA